MKITKLSLVAAGIAIISLLGFKAITNGSIKGKVSPADAAVRVWVMSATDTLKAPVESGTFTIGDVKPGTYKVVIEAKPPYKNGVKDGVTIGDDSNPVDVGEIKLSQ
jgi:hypothetical protein